MAPATAVGNTLSQEFFGMTTHQELHLEISFGNGFDFTDPHLGSHAPSGLTRFLGGLQSSPRH